MVLDFIKQRLCRFLIHRYMGDYLKTTIKPENLEIELFNGSAVVRDVNLNVQHINTLLEPIGIVNVVEGLVGEVSIKVPFQNLQEESTEISIKNLFVTLTPLKNINASCTQDLMSSVIGTLVNSMDTSIIQEEMEDATKDVIDEFAGLIDQVVTRVKIQFSNITVRLENEGYVNTAVEVFIKEMEFIDEQLEICRQEKMKEKAVTAQPGSSKVDLNKLLHIKDVKVYTDVWTPPEVVSSISADGSSDVGDMNTSMANSSMGFQSCYSHFSSNGASISRDSKPVDLRSKPIQVAHFFGEKHTVKIRVHNATLSKNEGAYGKKIEIDMQMAGSLLFYLTPSQLFLLQDIFSRLVPQSTTDNNESITIGGMPMKPEHYDQLSAQLQTEGAWMRPAQSHSWNASGDAYFHDMSKRSSSSNLVPVSLDYDDYSNYSAIGSNFRYDSTLDSDSVTETCTQRGSNSTLVDKASLRPPDVFMFTMQIPNIIGVITHEDPLSKENTEKALAEDGVDGIVNVMEKLYQDSAAFFQSIANIKLSSLPLYQQRKYFNKVCLHDHLMLLAQKASIRFNNETNGGRDGSNITVKFFKFDLVESLKKESIHQASKGEIIDLLNFGDCDDLAFSFNACTNHDQDICYSVEINCQPCQTEIDLSIIDRLHNLIITRPFFTQQYHLNNYSRNEFDLSVNSPKCRVQFYCSKWDVNLRIPKADLSAEKVPFWQRNVHEEYPHIELNKLRLDMPKFRLSDVAQFGSIHVNCHSMTGTFIGDNDFLECKEDEKKFLHATSLTGTDDTHVCFSINYDYRNKSLHVNTDRILDPMSRSMNQSMYGSYFKFNNDKNDGPFAQTNEFIEGTKLLLAGNREELNEFANNSRRISDVFIELSLPRLHLYFPSKKFFEVLYNRFANDFALFSPKASVFQETVNFSTNQSSNEPVFKPFINDYDEYYENNDSDDSKPVFDDRSSTAHKLGLCVKLSKGNILLGTYGVENEKEFKSQVGLEVDKSEFFLVFGYHGDPNLVYMFIAADKSSILHRNLLNDKIIPFESNVSNVRTFLRRNADDVFAEPLKTDEFCQRVDDNNIAVAVKLYTHYDKHEEKEFKDVTLAIAARNTLVHFRPFKDPEHFWINQLSKFVCVEDYGVPGYEWPQVVVDLNVHMTSVVVAYDHSNVVPESPIQLRLAIGSCDLASNIVENMERFKFHFFLEETKAFIGVKKKEIVRFQGFGDPQGVKQKFVKFLSLGVLKLELNYSLGNMESENPDDRCPSIEVICSNDMLTAWVCADTIVEFANMMIEFSQSEYACGLSAKEEFEPEPVAEFIKAAAEITTNRPASPALIKQEIVEINNSKNGERSRVMELMSSAMEDEPIAIIKSTTDVRHPDNSFSDDEALADALLRACRTEDNVKSNGSTDDEFIVVDEIPGSGITQPSGAPRVKIFDEGFEIISDYLNIPSTDTSSLDMMKNLDEHSAPILKYFVRDFSILVYLYGGNDLSDAPSEVKPYSQWEEKRESNQCMREGSVGGLFRDHTVCVQATISKISFLSEVFAPSSKILSRNMLTIYDIELRDHLLVSDINKLFYQFTSELLPRRSYSPMVAIRMIEDQNREGKLKVSLLPMRLNVDQDTLEFLQDFFNIVGTGIKLPTGINKDLSSETPLFQMPDEKPVENNSVTVNQDSVKFNKDTSESEGEETIAFGDDMTNSLDQMLDEFNKKLENSSETVNNTIDVYVEETKKESLTNTSSKVQLKETFFKSFIFSPGCKIRLDYVGKRVKMDHEQGTFAGLLLGLSNLHCTELVLKELNNEKGFLGYGKCVHYAVDEWVNDIKQNQVPNVIGSFGPITSLVEIARGITDLFYIPLSEYRKEDGRLVKGLQRGASSFGVSAATAAIDTTQWVASMVHTVAEIAFDIVTPDYQSAQRVRREQEAHKRRVPNDIREGFHMAMGTVYEGVVDSAQTLQHAAQEDRIHGQWRIRGLLRHATPMAVKPIVIATQATMQVLGGIKSQLRPDSHREEIEKWKNAN